MFDSRLGQAPSKSICLGCWLTMPHPKYSGLVAQIRVCTEKVQRTKLKGKLPVIITAGVFKDRFILEQYSGLACIDIDGQDNTHIRDWDKVKHMMRSLPYVAYAGLSCGGNGLLVLVRIKEYESQKEDIFPIIKSDFKQFGIDVDQSKKGGSDIRYYSIDSTPYINHESIYIQPPRKLLLPKINETSKPQFTPSDTTGSLRNLIESFIQNNNRTFDYKEWIELGMGLVYEFGEDGRLYFHQLSKPDERYDYHECDRQYSEILKRDYTMVTGGTVRYLLS